MYTEKVLKTVKATIEKNGLFKQNDTVVIGLSGGADSVVLLDVLTKIAPAYNLTIKAAHINHKIRKGDAEKDAEYARELCESYGVEFHLKEADIPALAKELKQSEEIVGRNVRYAFFEETANGGKIATAHHANDNAETVVMRFLRGCGVHGLSGIPVRRGNVVRPLLNVTRSEIEGYARENNLSYVIDSTNLKAVYTRNKVRLNLIPQIQKEFNPGFVETLNQNIQSYAEDDSFLSSEAQKSYDTLCSYMSGKIKCNRTDLSSLHPAIGKRVLIKMIQNVKNDPCLCCDPKKVQSVWDGLDAKSGKTFLLGEGFQVRIEYDCIFAEKIQNQETKFEAFDFVPKESVFDVGGLKVKCTVVEENLIDNRGNVMYLPYEEFCGKTLTFRTRKVDDVFQTDWNTSVKLNRYMTGKKIPDTERDFIPVLAGEKVLWILGKNSARFKNRKGKFFKLEVM